MQRTRKLEDLLTGKEAEISEATHRAVATEERLQKCEQEASKREASSERALAAARKELQSTQEESLRLREDYERRLDEANRATELERAGEDTATSMQRTRKLEDLLTGKETEISEATHRADATEERLQKGEQEASKREASLERALAAARRGLQSAQEES